MANVTDLKRGLGKEDAMIFSELEAAGWTIELENFKYVWHNHDANEALDPCDDDEEAIRAARVLHEGLPKKPAAIIDTAAEGKSHTQIDHEVGLRGQVLKHLIEQGYQPQKDVACNSGIADIVTPDAIYEINCGLNDDTLEAVAYKVNGYCNDINPGLDSIIVTCCAEEPEELKGLERQYGVKIQTLEEFTAPKSEQAKVVEQTALPGAEPTAPQRTALVQQMHPSKIRTHPQTLMRAEGLNEEHVNDLREVLRKGGNFKDAVDVYFDGQDYHLADGNHRHAAALAEEKLLDVDVHKGTLRDAILHAVRANSGHGLKRSNDSKRLAVVTLLSDPEWFKLSDTQLAEMAVVTQQFVSSVRRDLAELIPALPEYSSDLEGGDATIADRLDISPGLVRVVRQRIPRSEAEQLTQNVLGDDRRRRGSDGVVRSTPTRHPEDEAPLFTELTPEAGAASGDALNRGEILKVLEFEQRERWARLEARRRSAPPSEQEIIEFQARHREYEDTYERAVEALHGDSDAVQEVRDRVEADEPRESAGETVTAEEATSDEGNNTAAISAEPAATPAPPPATPNPDPLKAKTTVEGVVELVRRYEAISLLDLEGLGIERVLINLAERDGLIKRSEAHGGKFIVVKPEERTKKPSIEELLKGKLLAISFTWIPGVKGKVSVTVNTTNNPQDATRALIDETNIRGFSEPVMQVILGQLKKKVSSAAATPAKGKSTKKPAARAAAKKTVAKKGAAKKSAAKKTKPRTRA